MPLMLYLIGNHHTQGHLDILHRAEGSQGMPLQNIFLRYVDYFELKAIKK